MDTSKTEISITLSITIWGYPSQYSHYTLPDTAYHCWNTCDSSNEAHLNLDRMYPKLHRDVSGAASWRICYYVGTYQMLRRDAISGTPKTPKYRYFYGNIWQIMAIKKLLQYRYQLTIRLLPAYMAIWQFFYKKKSYRSLSPQENKLEIA